MVIDPREPGMVPVRLFESSSNCDNFVSPPITDGMVPVKSFPSNLKNVIFASFPISFGRLPTILLLPKFNEEMFVRLQMDEDKVPVRALLLKSRFFRVDILYNELGILPMIFLLLSMYRMDRAFIFDINDGMVPQNEFFPKFKYPRFIRLNIDADIFPWRRFELMSKYVSLVNP
jgi:hypothetical protein